MAVFLPFFCFLFLFFLNHEIIDLGTKSCMELALWHIKTLIPNTNKKKVTKFKQNMQKLSKQDYPNPLASPSMTNKKKSKVKSSL